MSIAARQTTAKSKRPVWFVQARMRHAAVLPILVFVLAMLGTSVLFYTLRVYEDQEVAALVRQKANSLQVLIERQVAANANAIRRMALRWDAANGTPEDQWLKDAAAYIQQIDGLRVVEWIDADGRMRWRQAAASSPQPGQGPQQGDQAKVDGAGLRPSQDVDSIDGFSGFRVSVPLHSRGQFDGKLVGAFDSQRYMQSLLSNDLSANLAVSLQQNGVEFYHHAPKTDDLIPTLEVTTPVRIAGRNWTLVVTPTAQFVAENRTPLPLMALVAGSIISLLLALALRAAFLARAHARRLEHADRLHDAVIAHSRHLIIATDLTGVVTLFNKAAEEKLGYAAEDVIGRQTPALWHDLTEVVQRAADLTQELGVQIEPGFDVFTAKPLKEGAESREWTVIARNGQRFAVNLTATPMIGSDGAPVGFLGMLEDVSVRKAAEAALQASEKTFRASMLASSIGMALVGPDGRWIAVNPALCALLDYSEEEFIANDVHSVMSAEDRDATNELRAQMISGEISQCQVERRFFHRTGRTVWALVSASAVRDTEGRFKHSIVHIQDISERRELDRLKGEFISVVSHELRTPLTSIRGSLGLMLGTLKDEMSSEAAEYTQMAYNNCERLILLINDILDIDKIAAGQMRFDLERTDIASLTLEAVRANKAYADKFGVVIDARQVRAGPDIEVDQGRYVQVLSNLLSNAIKFSPVGKTVKVAIAASGPVVRVSVTDEGAGISDEFRARIFGKFAQADGGLARGKGGSGLGLHIARQIVLQMNGEIGFESKSGKGSTFWVEFPRLAPPARIENPASAVRVGAADLPQILHIEDDVDFCGMIRSILNGHAEITTAHSRAAAQALLKTRRFDLIVLDQELPDSVQFDWADYFDGFKTSPGGVPAIVTLTADVPPPRIRKLAVATLLKSRVSEAKIAETILRFSAPPETEDARVA